jgi:uncharacterized membrane protein SpoIIM required for sporulation/ABC-type transport system involved in multi-copper enzyme maturation permease subunit
VNEKLRFVWLLSRRELRDQLRDWRILTPLLILTFGFPFLMNFVAFFAVQYANQYGGNLIVDRLVPFSILIIGFFPLAISLLGALESFVGEKERGTIEPLLSLPLADWQLYFGKLVAGIVMPMVASFSAISVYVFMVSYQKLNLPSPLIFTQLFLLTISHAFLMVSAAIVISVQSTSVKGANLMASFVIVPVTMLMMGETSLFFRLNSLVLWLAILAVAIMAGLIIRLGLAHFQREYLLGRELDVLNLRWIWSTFWMDFRGDAHSILDWYRSSLRTTMTKLAWPILVVSILGVLGMGGGYFAARSYVAEGKTVEGRNERLGDLRERIRQTANVESFGDSVSAPALFKHNIQSTLVITLFGLFSISVLGIVLYLINFGVIGAVLGALQMAGCSPGKLFLFGILPHGIFEIPALVIAGAAVLYMGLSLVTPQTHRTLGEVIIESLADWLRVMLGLVVPLFAVAAVIETYVTPQLLNQFMQSICN